MDRGEHTTSSLITIDSLIRRANELREQIEKELSTLAASDPKREEPQPEFPDNIVYLHQPPPENYG